MDEKDKRLYELKAEIFRAIGHPIRLGIIEVLSGGEMCVCDIAKKVGAQRSNVSRHLSVMLRAGVLGVRRDGLKMIYELKTPCIRDFLSCVTEAFRDRIETNTAMLQRL